MHYARTTRRTSAQNASNRSKANIPQSWSGQDQSTAEATMLGGGLVNPKNLTGTSKTSRRACSA